MIVNRGIFPPILAVSLASWSKSRGSYAILLPPANADPACVFVGWALKSEGSLCDRLKLLGARTCSSSSGAGAVVWLLEDPAAPTRRRERPAVDMGGGGWRVVKHWTELRGARI